MLAEKKTIQTRNTTPFLTTLRHSSLHYVIPDLIGNPIGYIATPLKTGQVWIPAGVYPAKRDENDVTIREKAPLAKRLKIK